ncbi:MAG TPA: hypothetical protein VG148_04075 [Pyrinomonadaceae bacterium]|nr:hypothetical protein [Pyrinomonadaceae bacterium]
MSFDEKRLYELLPAVYRIRDAEQGEPLRALLAVVAEQVAVLEENLSQLYDDQFAETCAPWVLPYIGDLIGITGLAGTNLQTLTRAEVARTIGYRRGKGTAATLEQLARDVSGRPARAVEFFQLIATTQHMNHLRPENQSFLSVRGAERLEHLGGAFERAAAGGADLTHTADVRRVAAGGRYNIPNVGLFLWRLRAFSLTRSPAVAADDSGRRFFFSPLGADLPLFNLPLTEAEAAHLAEPVNVPAPVGRRAMARSPEDYYGRGRSLLVELAHTNLLVEPEEVSAGRVVVCDLTGWPAPPPGRVAIDPALGRLAFPEDPPGRVLVTFHYGFSAKMGGGEYTRLRSSDEAGGRAAAGTVASTFSDEDAAAPPGVRFVSVGDALAALGPEGGTVEIADSGRYAETLKIEATCRSVELRAADKRRPTLVLGGDLEITGCEGGEVVLDGLLITGGAVRVSGELDRLRLSHCTLVPGLSLAADGAPSRPGEPSLFVEAGNVRVEIDHCIVGGIVTAEDTEVQIADSIVDASDEENLAYAGTEWFGGPVRVTNSTVIGRVRATVMRLASNTIFLASVKNETYRELIDPPVFAERRQEGCVRFSYLSPGARVPPRYHCQPEPDDSPVRPRLVSARFRDPAYCLLSALCPAEIRQGADDESEMGAFHDLFEPQRAAHLRARVEEYLRFGLDAGTFHDV